MVARARRYVKQVFCFCAAMRYNGAMKLDAEHNAQGRVPTRRDAIETRKRLLEAAAEVFGRSGFHGASVREICGEAGANISAVRHYFGGKEGLYQHVLLKAVKEMRERDPLPDFGAQSDPEATVRGWTLFYARLLLIHKAEHPVVGNLISHELKQPTAALDEILKVVVRPIRRSLEEAIGVLLGPADSTARRMHCASTIQGIIIARELGKAPLNRLGALPVDSEAAVAHFANEIATFALGGIRAVREAALATGGDA